MKQDLLYPGQDIGEESVQTEGRFFQNQVTLFNVH